MNSLKLREMLGNLGSRIDDLDTAYANKVRNFIVPNESTGSKLDVIRGLTGEVVGAPLSRPFPIDGQPESMLEAAALRGIQVGIPAASATARYVVPAAGVTAAGMGLMEIAQALSEEEQPYA